MIYWFFNSSKFETRDVRKVIIEINHFIQLSLNETFFFLKRSRRIFVNCIISIISDSEEHLLIDSEIILSEAFQCSERHRFWEIKIQDLNYSFTTQTKDAKNWLITVKHL